MDSRYVAFDGEWSCSACTFGNKAHTRACEVCQAPRPAAAAAAAAGASGQQDGPHSPLFGTDERRHGCCVRILIFPIACFSLMASLMLSAFQLMHYLFATVCEMLLKLFCVKYVCPRPCEKGIRRLIVCPCRWLRVSLTGKGHLGCCYDDDDRPAEEDLYYAEQGGVVSTQPRAAGSL
jgi:hypothetical protein